MKRLLAIQTELKCNKSQYNSFAKYSYRSCEDILESVKPLLKKYGVCLVLSDDLILPENGDAYICAIATLYDAETNEQITQTRAFAQVDKTHKGMSADQQVGCASSYARKYCCSALLLLDDNKDADTDEHHIENEAKKNKSAKPTVKDLKAIADKADELGKTQDILTHYKVKSFDELNEKQIDEVVKTLKKYSQGAVK